jgi:hypothetical protein
MAKQGFNFTMGTAQIKVACEAYMRALTEPGYDLEALVGPGSSVTVRVTKIRASRKAKPKVAAVPKAVA